MVKFIRESMMGNKYLISTILGLALAWTAPLAASASQITFDTNGAAAGGQIQITALDPVPGNALAIGASAGSAVGSTFGLLYQANLGTTTLSGVPNYLNGSNGFFYTVVAGFNETVISNTGGANPFLQFGFSAGGTTANFFKMYANTTGFASDLSGTGFTLGTEILSGLVTGIDFTSSFNVSSGSSPGVALDQLGANDYPGTNTITGSGASSITVQITGFDPNFFPGGGLGTLSFLLANTSQVTPYNQTDPSAAFSSNGIANGDQAGVSTVGAINGLSGPNTMFQADSNIAINVVPEPMSLLLLGSGVLGLAGLRRMRRIKR